MERPGTPRRRPETPSAPTTLTEITRRYYTTALALAKAMGLPLTETFIRKHRESITTCFIEAGRAGVRLPPAVPLPPLIGAPDTPAARANGQPVEPGSPLKSDLSDDGDTPPVAMPPDTPEAAILGCIGGLPPTPEAPPTTIQKDAGLPCGGRVIADLKPAALAMIIAKTARLVHDQGEVWVPLLGALQVERASRLAQGQRRSVTPVRAPGPDGPPPAISIASGARFVVEE